MFSQAKPLVDQTKSYPRRINVFIMGYVTFSLGCYMVCCSIASLAVGYIYLSCSHLYSFASYDRPYALKIKYPVTRGFSQTQFFACCYMKGLARFVCLLNHCYTSIVQIILQGSFSCCIFLRCRVFILCCFISIHIVDQGIIKRVAHGSC